MKKDRHLPAGMYAKHGAFWPLNPQRRIYWGNT